MTEAAAVHPMAYPMADLTICMAIEAIRQMRDMPPSEGQKLLRASWNSHASDYKRLLAAIPPGNHALPESRLEAIAELTALSVLSAYFAHCGDWNKMIDALEERRKELKP